MHNISKAFMLDEWEVRLYVIIPSLQRSSTLYVFQDYIAVIYFGVGTL